jgi:predicted RND superfamily exporter protein
LIASLIERITGLLLRRPRAILGVTLLIVLASGFAASRIRLDPDVLNLIPRNNREVNEFRGLISDTGTLDFHVVVLELPKDSDPAAYGPLLDSIGNQLRASEKIEYASWSIPDPLSLVERVMPYSMLVLTPQQLDQVAEKLTDASLRAAVERNRALLQTPQSTLMKQLVRIDPFNLLPIYAEKVQRAGGGLKIDFSSGYYVAADHSAAIIIAKPRRAAQELPFSRAVIEETRAITDKALAEFRAASPDVQPPKIGFTGGYAIAAGDEAIIRQDMAVNSVTSFVGILLLYLYAFRRPSALLYSGVPMAVAIIVTFGIGALTLGTLSAASTGFAALLAGLGVDFMTVLYERFVDERNRGADLDDAIRTVMRHTLPGVVVGALTTAATFYAFLATNFRGMTELGFLTGSGILVFLLCVMFVFPALIIVTERRRHGRRTLQVHGFGTSPLVAVSVARPRLVIGVWVVVVLISLVGAFQVRFSDELQNLRSRGNEGVRLQEMVTAKFGQAFEGMMYGVRGKTASEAIAKTEAALPELEQITRKGVIDSYQSIAAFVPSEGQQRQVIAKLEAGKSSTFDFERIRTTFNAALVENGFAPHAYERFLELFEAALVQREPLTVETLERLGLDDSVRRYIKKTDDGYLSIVYLYPTGGRWPRFLPDELQEFRARHPEGVLTGVNLISQTLRTIVLADAVRASILGFAIVFALLWIGFRSFTRACFVFVPFIAGGAAMLGFMGAFGFTFNFMNIFIGLMLVGTATDYAVYMLQRYDEAPHELAHNGKETARAVTLAALMSIVGFASFGISHYPGVRSIGYSSVVGIALSCLASITLLPALLATGKFRHRNAAMLGEAPHEDADPESGT